MGYADVEVFAGKDHAGNDVLAGFRFTSVTVAQGAVVTEAKLTLWLEEMYPEGMAVLDHFTDTNGVLLSAHTPDVGPVAGWSIEAGSLNIESNYARTIGSALTQVAVVDGESADGTLKCSVNPSSGQAGIVFRFADTDNYWLLAAYSNLRLYKYVAGVETEYACAAVELRGQWSDLKVVLDGDDIAIYLEGVNVYNRTDSDHSANTEHGLGHVKNVVPKEPHWDDFEFIPSGTPSPNLEAACDDVDDSDDFSVSLPDARTPTTARAALGDISGWTKEDWNETVDIKAPVQEVLDRPGWVSGNQMSVLLLPLAACANGERIRVTAYENATARAAKLYIVY